MNIYYRAVEKSYKMYHIVNKDQSLDTKNHIKDYDLFSFTHKKLLILYVVGGAN